MSSFHLKALHEKPQHRSQCASHSVSAYTKAAFKLATVIIGISSTANSFAITPIVGGYSACNSPSFSKIPGTADLYVGRYIGNHGDPTNQNSCPNPGVIPHYLPALYKFQNNFFQLQRNLMNKGDSLVDGNHLVQGYDPEAFSVRGKNYMAFECDLGRPNESVGLCISELSANQTVVPNSTRLFVKGKFASSNNHLSASVPKVVSYQNRTYLYWSAVEFNANNSFKRLTTRGTELLLNSANQFVNKEGKTQIFSDESDIVMNTSATGTADITDIAVGTDNYLYAVSHIGDNGCTSPDPTKLGCYRTEVTRSATPLGNNVFGRGYIPTGLPQNTGEYAHWLWENNTLYIAGKYFPLGSTLATPSQYRLYDVSGQFNVIEAGTHNLIRDYVSPVSSIVGENIIKRLYNAFLGRDPESTAAIQNWSNHLQANGLNALVSNIALSGESNARNTYVGQFVTACYQGILGRSPESQNVIQHWTNQVNARGRAAVLVDFINSAESQAKNQY